MVHAGHRRTAGSVHALHAAHVHLAHAHILHIGKGTFAKRGYLGCHAFARGQSCARHARPINRFADQSVGTVIGRGDNDVVGFRHRNLELVDLHRPYV